VLEILKFRDLINWTLLFSSEYFGYCPKQPKWNIIWIRYLSAQISSPVGPLVSVADFEPIKFWVQAPNSYEKKKKNKTLTGDQKWESIFSQIQSETTNLTKGPEIFAWYHETDTSVSPQAYEILPKFRLSGGILNLGQKFTVKLQPPLMRPLWWVFKLQNRLESGLWTNFC
jgi:hypothetical protein